MLSAARSLASRAARGRGLTSAAAAGLLPPLKVAVTGAAGQIGYALVMRIARYVARRRAPSDARPRRAGPERRRPDDPSYAKRERAGAPPGCVAKRAGGALSWRRCDSTRRGDCAAATRRAAQSSP
jgi:NAD(P)-dependent dehydrogenase (short-subunit alcohol dehydrogenase family)